MRPGSNPTRRNRNIGTAKQGHGQDNRLTIPTSWADNRIYWEALKSPVAIPRRIAGRSLTFLVEPTRPESFYPCTVDDVSAVLGLVPQEDLDGIELVLLRQPTRKQARLNPVWGRFLYLATLGPYVGPAICIEAQDLSETLEWPNAMSTDDRRELRRLEHDGHRVIPGRRAYTIERTPESVRNTVLFRTLLHEIGHNVDWIQNVSAPSVQAGDRREVERIHREFASKPSKDREDFAHRYADGLSRQLRARNAIPFERSTNVRSMVKDGLDPAWFAAVVQS